MRLSTFSSPSAILWRPDSVPGGERAGWRALHRGGGAGSGGRSCGGSLPPPSDGPLRPPGFSRASSRKRRARSLTAKWGGEGGKRPALRPAPPPRLRCRWGACAPPPPRPPLPLWTPRRRRRLWRAPGSMRRASAALPPPGLPVTGWAGGTSGLARRARQGGAALPRPGPGFRGLCSARAAEPWASKPDPGGASLWVSPFRPPRSE